MRTFAAWRVFTHAAKGAIDAALTRLCMSASELCFGSELPVLAIIAVDLQVALSKQSPYVKSAHRVSGLMVANHTSIRFLLEKCLRGFNKLYPKYYVDHYKDFSKFNDGQGNLVRDEFDDAAEVVQGLCDEYKACEQDDYIGAMEKLNQESTDTRIPQNQNAPVN